MALTIFAEVICASLIAIGLCTSRGGRLIHRECCRLVIHGEDP